MVEEDRGAGVPGEASPAVIVWMILLGGYSAINGLAAVPQWSAYSTWTQLYYAASIAAGGCLAALGVIRAAFRAKAWFLPIAEVGVLVVLTANQSAGLLWEAIPCSTPG
jgi:hypothetical protein